MRVGTILVGTIGVVLGLLGVALLPRDAVAEPSKTLQAIIEATNAKLVDFVSKGDAAAFAGAYSVRAKVLPPHGEIVSGRAEIEKFWKGMMDGGMKKLRLTTLEVEGRGGEATELGTYEVFGEADRLLDRGKYFIFWKAEAGQWRIYRDVWNTSLPAPAQEAAK